MRSSNKQRLEDEKYIYASDFIELIAFHTKANIKIERIAAYLIDENFDQHVTSYLLHDKSESYIKDLYRESFGYDLNTRDFLTQCDSIKYATTKYFLYSHDEDLDDSFLYLIDELKSIECIKNLNINFDSSVMFQLDEASRKWNDEIEKPIFKVLGEEFNNPELRYEFLLHLIKRDSFNIMQAACLVAGNGTFEIEKYQNHFRFTEVFSDYISYKLMLELAVKNDELQLTNGFILSLDLQKYLFENGYIVKGFNDWLTIEPAKPLIGKESNEQLEASYNELKEAQAKISDLESQLVEKEANASFMMGTPTVEQGGPRDSEQIISDLKKQIKQLTADQDQAQTTIAELKEQLNIANTTLTNTKSVSIAQPFDWQNMSEHIYPPELHLALMVWQRIYWDNELKDSHITSHNGKFEAIAKKINLNPKSTLGKRVRMVINTAQTKKKQSELAEQLQAIDHINISAN